MFAFLWTVYSPRLIRVNILDFLEVRTFAVFLNGDYEPITGYPFWQYYKNESTFNIPLHVNIANWYRIFQLQLRKMSFNWYSIRQGPANALNADLEREEEPGIFPDIKGYLKNHSYLCANDCSATITEQLYFSKEWLKNQVGWNNNHFTKSWTVRFLLSYWLNRLPLGLPPFNFIAIIRRSVCQQPTTYPYTFITLQVGFLGLIYSQLYEQPTNQIKPRLCGKWSF